MPDELTVIRHAEQMSVTLPGGAAYQPIVGDDTGAGVPIRTGIQTSHPGYTTPLHSHPYAEVLAGGTLQVSGSVKPDRGQTRG